MMLFWFEMVVMMMCMPWTGMLGHQDMFRRLAF